MINPFEPLSFIEDQDFRIIGVIRPWRPTPKYYDPHNGDFEAAEEIFMPFRWGQNMEIRTAGNIKYDLEPDPSPEPIRHPLLGRYFDSFQDGRYSRKRQLN